MVAFASTGLLLCPSASTFTSRTPLCYRPRKVSRCSTRRVVNMGIGEDGLEEDLDAARQCIDGGCEIDAVQKILTRLEQRRAVLALEVDQINEVMAILAKENLGGDRNLVAQAMEAALRIFSKTDDNFPKVGGPSPWTLDKPKKKNTRY
eukprot:Plantae.Rhodophyta-Hildenbrandia_rubra.ctg8044.p2 GENE.Plantae.Rhodophyta-Hildenbrandia_rubra.ctg8044~~Plantae.Rhodophyta-Hildenbrandia_rubra.ctg8044.p2  ORF type:complete len:149 (-),score=31.86 Plantae.Rhodophyta-Hildenbrandia_rubra.ctg8044:781-1227(-)